MPNQFTEPGQGTSNSYTIDHDAGNSRIFSLDVIRGIALLGILLISIWEFGGFSINQQTGIRISTKANNHSLLVSMLFLFEGKMRALFSLVFGAGMMLYMNKPNRLMLPTTQELYIRRQMWLIAFGLINAIVLLWPGDILFQYGVMGILLFPFFRMSKKGLLIAAIFCTLIYCGKLFWNYADDKTSHKKFKAVTLVEDRIKKDSATRHNKDSISGMTKTELKKSDSLAKKRDTLTKEQQKDKGAWEGLVKNIKYDSTKVKDSTENKAMHAGYAKMWNHLLERSQWKEALWLYRIGVWDIGSMMLLGMALFGFGFFSPDFSKTKYILFAVIGILAGLSLAWFRLHYGNAKLIDYEKYITGHALPPNQFFPIERLLMAIGYAGLIMLLLRLKILQWLWQALASVGRMAFTNYLMQTIICTLFFYGYGFGYFGRLSLPQLYFFVAEIWLVQTVCSIVWLRYYEYGPVEWLWRWLIYGKRFPNNKKTG
jgi:uncharacterized protein